MSSIILPCAYSRQDIDSREEGTFSNAARAFFIAKLESYTIKVAKAIESMVSSVLVLKWYIYPFKGIFVFFEKNYFWKEACLVFLTYSTKFILIAILYYFIIFPFVLGISTLLLGPLGVTVAVIHSVLHVNCYANKTTRLASARHGLQIFNKLMQNSDDRHRMTLGLVNWNIRKDQWRGTHWSRRLPSMLCRFVRVWVSSTAQFLLSLVPIVGIILVSQLNVANRGYDYAEIFLELQMPNAIQNGMAYYEEFGKNAIFGQVAGILESIPILSGLLITTNYVARALWFQDDLISAMSSN